MSFGDTNYFLEPPFLQARYSRHQIHFIFIFNLLKELSLQRHETFIYGSVPVLIALFKHMLSAQRGTSKENFSSTQVSQILQFAQTDVADFSRKIYHPDACNTPNANCQNAQCRK